MSSARDRTLLHLKRLAAAATVVSTGTATIAACKKEPVKGEDEAGAKSKDTDAGSATAVVHLDATAPSTADSATFVETTTKDAGDWRQVVPHTGYAVVDPMPPPTRIPPRGDGGKDTCNPPFYIDAQGRKHYKKNCL